MWSGVDSGSSVARALLQLQKPTQVPLGAFLAALDGSKASLAEKTQEVLHFLGKTYKKVFAPQAQLEESANDRGEAGGAL